MRVEFRKFEDNGRHRCSWVAVRGKRTRVPGTVMAVGHDIPHDLGQYVIEAATGYEYGFWGLVEKGATFKSTGRRLTKPGRAVVAMHRRELAASEQLAGVHLGRWKSKRPGPVSVALDRALAQWRGMGSGDRLVFDWPSADGTVEPTGHGGTDQYG